MADNKLLKSINTNVKKINNNTKHFGTKMPSNDNWEKDIQQEDLTYSQMIMGSLASLVWGKTSVKKAPGVNSLLGVKDNIFSLVQSIKDNIYNSYNGTGSLSVTIKNTADLVKTVKPDKTAVDGSSDISKIIVELKADKSLDNLVTAIEKINNLSSAEKSDKNVVSSLNTILGFFQKLNREMDDLNMEKIKANALKINQLFNDKGPLNELISTISNYKGIGEKNSETIKSLEGIFKIIEISANLMEGHDKKPNEAFFKSLTKILTGEKYIKGLISNINELGEKAIDDQTQNNIEVIDDIISTVSRLGELGIIHLIKSKISIKAINGFLINDIKELISNIQNLAGSENKTDKSFDTLTNIFEAISKLGELNIKRRRAMRRNLEFIKSYLLEDIKGLIKDQMPTIEDGQKEAFDLILKTNELFKSLLNIGELGGKDFRKSVRSAERKLNILTDFITNDIVEFFKELNQSFKDLNQEKLDNIFKKIDQFDDVFAAINSINEALPNMTAIFKANIKLMALNIELILVRNVVELLDEINRNMTTAVMNFLSRRLPTLLSNINKVNEAIGNVDTSKGIKSILKVDDELLYLWWCLDLIKDIEKSFDTKVDFKPIIDTFANLNDVIKELSKEKLDVSLDDIIDIKDDVLKKLDKTIELIKKFDQLSKVGAIAKLSNIGLEAISREAELINVIIGKFSDVKKEQIESAQSSIDIVQKLVVTSALILIIVSVAMKAINLENLVAFTVSLSFFLLAITTTFKILGKSLNESLGGTNDAIKLVAISALIMLLGAKALDYVDPVALLAFTGALWLFMEMICAIYSENADLFETAMEGAKDAMIIVGVSALVLALGANLLKPKDFLNAFVFTVSLGIFLAGLMYIFSKLPPNEEIKTDIKTTEDIATIIGIAGMALWFGALISSKINWANLLLFELGLMGVIFVTTWTLSKYGEQIQQSKDIILDLAVLIGVSGLVLIMASIIGSMINPVMLAIFELELAALIWGVLYVYKLASKGFKTAITGARDLAILVGVSGLILILAGLVVDKIDLWSLVGFTLILGAFIATILFVYSLASKGFKHAFEGAKEMVILIGVSALILIIGSLIVQKWVDIPSLIAFTVILAGFMIAIGFAYSLMSKTIKKSIGYAIFLGILVAISGAVLLLGASYITENPWLVLGAIGFAALLLVFIGEMALICTVLGELKKEITKGMPVMALLLGLTYLSTLVINNIAETASKEGFLINIIKGIGSIAAVMVAIGGIAIAAGGLLFGPQAAIFAVGMAAMTTIAGLALLAAQAVKNIAIAMIYMNAVQSFSPDIMINNIKGFIEIAKEMKPLAKSFGVIMKTSMAISMMGAALSSIANVITSWANLRIPIYEGTKIVGYETITKDAFPIAANNIKEVVKALGQAVIDVYEENPEIFNGPLLGANVGQSKFARVSKSLKTMGPMLSSIAKAIKSWASLKIPVYEGTKIVKYENITNTDFVTAAVNIKTVVKTLAEAVIEAYDEKPELFESDGIFGLGNSKFAKVAKSLKTMGPMLSSIANAIKKWTNLKIPTYTGTEITGYTTLTNDDFIKAGEHIQQVIITLGSAIIATYDVVEGDPKTKGMFDSTGFLGLGKSKFAQVVKAFKTMGPMLSSIADGIVKWADLKIAKYDNNGNIIGYDTLVDGDFTNAGENIKKVLVCIGQALCTVVEENPKIFNDKAIGESPAIVAAKAMRIMGETLNLTATAVASYASGEFPIFDKDGKYVNSITIDPTTLDAAGEKIKSVLECIGNALGAVVKGNPEIFNDGLFKNSPAAIASEAIKNMSTGINSIVNVIGKLMDLKLDDIHTALDPNGPTDNIYHKLYNIIEFTKDIVDLFLATKKDKNGKSVYGSAGGFIGIGDHDASFAEYLNKNNKALKGANTALNTLITTLQSIFDKYATLGKQFMENEAALNLFTYGNGIDASYSPIYQYLKQAIDVIAVMIDLFTAEENIEKFKLLISEKPQIDNNISALENILTSLFKSIGKIKPEYEALSEFNFNNIIPLIQSFNNCVDVLTKIRNRSNESFVLNIPRIDNNTLPEDIKNYSDSLLIISKAAENASEISEEGFNVLRDGILNIYTTTEQITDNKHFTKLVKDLKEYVQSINNIQLNKLNSLTNLVDAMNTLSSNLGNLDDLTDAIANNLSAVLYELVSQLRKADVSINNAHELQLKRKQLIEANLKEIEKIMGQPMIVEVSQKVEDEELEDEKTKDNNKGTINGNDASRDQGPGEDGNTPSRTPQLDNPENATASRAKGAGSPNALTMEQFKQFMMSEYSNEIKKLIVNNVKPQ